MPAYKDKAKGTWYASFYYEDWTGKKVKKMKRGFPTKREALEWERTFLQQQTADLEMTFENFVAALCGGHERPYQGKHLGDERAYPLQEVGAVLRQAEDVRHSLQGGHRLAERNAGLPGRRTASPILRYTLKTLHNQLSAVFNHAVRHYNLKVNPAAQAGNMGKAKGTGNAVLDKGGVSEIRRGHDGQAPFLLRL